MAIASITLLNNDDAGPIIESVLADNEGTRVLNIPGAVKLDRDDSLTINRASVSERLGREWDPQEIHLVIISMAGNLDEDDDAITLSWRR